MMGHNNYPLERIANSICACVLTDGFCSPRHDPDCRCWRAARAAVEGLHSQSDPALQRAWPRMGREDRRAHLNWLCESTLRHKDELSEPAKEPQT